MANATRYFDTNGATAGFGTLTQAWNTTGAAYWSSSSAGTVATTDYTFDNTDTAQFGFVGTTATAGTATITASLNVTVNQVVTANMTGLQTIAAGAGGSLTLAGTTPTINVGSAGGLTITAPVAGTAGFTKAGANTLTFSNSTPTTSNTLTGDVTVNAGTMIYGTGNYALANSTSTVPVQQLNPTSVSIASTAALQIAGATNAALPTFTGTYSGDGYLWPWTGQVAFASPGITFTGDLTALGPATPAKARGLYFQNNGNNQRSIVTAYSVPRAISYFNGAGSAATSFLQSFEIHPDAIPATSYATKIFVYSFGSTAVTLPTNSQRFLANQNNGNGPIVLTGGVERSDDASGDTDVSTLTLGGTNTDSNELSGTIAQATATGGGNSGPLAIAKIGIGRWVLSGANTYTSTTTISAGTLVAASTSAFGSSAAGANVTLVAGATMGLSHATGINLIKTSATINLQGGTVKNELGDNTVTASTSPLTVSATTFDIAAGSLAWTPTISGTIAAAISKAGTGTLKLDNAANSYTGTTTITAGTLEVTKIAGISGGNSSIGAPTTSANGTISMTAGTTLKHTGTTADTTDRIISGSSAGTLTIDSSGTGSGALSLTTTNSGAITVFATGSSTLVFTGTNTAANTCARTLANPASSGTTAVTKTGANTWTLTGTLSHTGITTVEAGELQLGATNRTLTGGVAISGGTLSNSTNTLDASVTMTGGTMTAPLTGTGTLTVNSGSPATIQPNVAATGSNAQTGAITVAAGAVVRLVTPDAVDVSTAGNGRVIGNGDVTCAGTIRTATSSTSKQKGQARYKSLTLNSGARIEPGAA